MNKVNSSKINFCATPKEIKSVKRACEILSQKVMQKGITDVPVDTAEIGSKTFLSALNNGKKSVIKLEMMNAQGIKSYTCLNFQTPEKNAQFLKASSTPNIIAEVLDRLKSALKKAENMPYD